MLGYIVEAITGVDFGEYCRKNIFEPLEMENSGFRLRDVEPSLLAGLYTSPTASTGQYSVKFYPATTIRSSIKEFSHFALAYLNGAFVGVSSNLSINTTDKLGLLIFTNIVNKSTVYPGGKIYELIREEAGRYR